MILLIFVPLSGSNFGVENLKNTKLPQLAKKQRVGDLVQKLRITLSGLLMLSKVGQALARCPL
nr:hypothetical protein Iba_chr13bCG12920 [Ipomoea batatas]